ncbi:MAG: hypothetical protein ASARMPREDX12_000737 [Alectoria sarmentosa]|nr:MAG: hypothetical protein ASARMPREDX12_000737 [Alectoria sarmentosa]
MEATDLELGIQANCRRLEGFPSFSHFIAGDRQEAIYRKFGSLSARSLLYQQSELHHLELQLETLDSEDACDLGNVAAQQRAREWDHFANDDNEDAQLRRELQNRIKRKVKEYRRRSIAFGKPNIDLESPSSKHLFDKEKDLVALAPVDTDRLNQFLAIYFGWLFREKRDDRLPPNMFSFPERRIQRAGAVISTLLSAVLLIGAIICLLLVPDGRTGVRVGIIVLFTSLFAGVVGLLKTQGEQRSLGHPLHSVPLDMSTYTDPEQIATAYSTLQQTFKTGKTKSIAWRKWQLKQVWWMVADNEEAMVRVLHSDLNRHDFESYWLDVGGVKRDILDHIKHLENWTADDIPDAGFLFGTLCGARIRKEPLGVILILGFYGGDLAKVSGSGGHSDSHWRPEGDRADLGASFRFDFYTGSSKIAKFVSAAAAKHLTPTVLELGGQAPCIVTGSADIDSAAKRITYSKFLNSGQICLAANHVFVDPSVHDKFVERAIHWLGQFLKGDGKDQETRIVNERNYDRLVGLVNQSRGKVAYGGDKSREDRYIQPTLVTNVNMQGEHPLGLYIFSTNQAEIDEILSKTSSGGVTVNDIMTHAGVPNTLFGGVGNSGTGAYHGRYGFDAFTHQRPVVYIPGWMDYLFAFRYPPYDKRHVSKITINKPGFKRGEGMEDQVIGDGKTGRLVVMMGKWAIIAVGMALLDATMGGRPRLLEILKVWVDGLRSLLPILRLVLRRFSMAHLLTVDVATANVSNTTFAHKLRLIGGPFGLQELESVLSFPQRYGKSWTISTRTSDVVAAVFTILVLTYAIDHYLFKSRYLVHIGGAQREKDHAAALDKKASLYEKEALILESGQKRGNDEDSNLDPKPEHDSESLASTARSRRVYKPIQTLAILSLLAMCDGKTMEEISSKTRKGTQEDSSVKADPKGGVDRSSPTSRWGRFVQHPWLRTMLDFTILFLGSLVMLIVFAFHLIFWPLLLSLFIALQCVFYEDLNHNATVPWQYIALKSTLYLTSWTIIGVTLLMKPNRLQIVLWKCFKWTHAVNWWLFWVGLYSYDLCDFVARRSGFHNTRITKEVIMFLLRPSLVAYLYSGVVRDAVVAVRLGNFFWNNDITKL